LRVERKDVLDAVHHLRGTGSVFDGAQVDHYRGQTYLSAPSDVGEFRLVLRFRVFTGLTPHSDDYVVVYDRRSETSRHLGNFSLRLLLLDYRRPLWTQKADLLAALRTDEAYFAAVLKELDGMGQDHAGRTAGDRLS
jgi:hypothetical protein